MKDKFNHNNIHKAYSKKHEHHNHGMYPTYPQSLSDSLNISTVFKTCCGQMFT